MTTMFALSDKTSLDLKLDLQNKQIVVIQKGEVGVQMGQIVVPIADIKNWGSKLKGLIAFFPLDLMK